MFIGEYPTQIGEKNRISLPKKLRDKMEGGLLLARGYENCLLMLDNKSWENLVFEINKKPLLSLNVRDTKRYILGGATELDLDNQGRFVLPEPLKSFAGLNKTVVFLGVGEWIEIWDLEKWESKLKKLSMEVSDIADRLSIKGEL